MNGKMLIIIGTRPEVIKLYPVVKELKKKCEPQNIRICFTGQHNELAIGLLQLFKIEPEYKLNVMQKSQSLNRLCGKLLIKFDKILKEFRPNWIIAQGDTASVWTSAMSAFHNRIKFAHIEAGLRTNNINKPFPEEMNRILTAKIANLHFAPTKRAYHNLVAEGVKSSRIKIVGNTGIDTLMYTLTKLKKSYDEFRMINFKKKIIIFTLHRRENQGATIDAVFNAIFKLLKKNDDIQIIFSLHYNPEVRRQVLRKINQHKKGKKDLLIINPPDYEKFIYLLKKCWLIVTDSGGIQEEAPTLNKPVLIVRETTERQECIEIGAAKLIGTRYCEIHESISQLLKNKLAYKSMCYKKNPFGDGNAAVRIVKHLLNKQKKAYQFKRRPYQSIK